MPKTHLTKTNKLTFARYWSGSIRETLIAMNQDGVKMAYRTCQRYIADPEVQNAIQTHSSEKNGVIKRDRIQAYWTAVMRDDSQNMQHRLRASELLAKSFGMFLEKPQETQEVSIADILDEDLKAIENIDAKKD